MRQSWQFKEADIWRVTVYKDNGSDDWNDYADNEEARIAEYVLDAYHCYGSCDHRQISYRTADDWTVNKDVDNPYWQEAPTAYHPPPPTAP